MVLFYSDKENSHSLVSHKSDAKFYHQGPLSEFFPVPRTLTILRIALSSHFSVGGSSRQEYTIFPL